MSENKDDKEKGFVEKQQERVAESLVQSASTEVSESWISKCNCACE